MKNIFLFCSILVSYTSIAQKKEIDHTVYNSWNRISEIQLSSSGTYTAYTIKPHRGDGYLYVVNNLTGKKDSVFRGTNPQFSGEETHLIFSISPGFDTLRTCELNKIKKDKWPKDSLGIWNLETQKLIKHPKIKSFQVHESQNWISYLSEENKLSNQPKKKKKWFQFKKKEEKKVESDGKRLTILHLSNDQKKEFINVTDVIWHQTLPELLFTTHQKEKSDSVSLTYWKENQVQIIEKNYTSIEKIHAHKKTSDWLFLVSKDTSEAKNYQLIRWNQTFGWKTIADSLPDAKSVSKNFAPFFTEDKSKIYFGIAPWQKPEPKDTLLPNEKAKVDVWNWKDDRLQPQQLVEQKRDEKKTQLVNFDLSSEKIQILSSDTLSVYVSKRSKSNKALGISVKPYQYAYNWDYPNKRDFYLVDLASGKTELLGKGLVHTFSLSPDASHFVYFQQADSQLYVKQLNTGKTSCITCSKKHIQWAEDVNGMPVIPEPYGVLGWTEENDVILQSHYDVWKFNPSNETLISMTAEQGSKQKIRFRLNEWNSDSVYFHPSNTYLTGFDEKDKSMSLYASDGNGKYKPVLVSPHQLNGIQKAKKGSQFILQKNSLQDYPDVFTGEWKNDTQLTQISHTNPQQKDYNWATVELIKWKSYQGIPLEGLLYKPENFDSTKSYPLLVYFYEMYSDELHNHYAPRPTASIIYPTEYASAGYVVLIPDIRYKVGHPAKSAYDCIMSGTDYVLKKHKNIDSTRMGLQGQSWGGYQTAQLITMTTRYRAAMAGAPVSNMFSAYGGIRWGSGLNRQFQYEHTQSRIGKTIWEAPELYVENSPLFHLPNVQTPLLIMHNDADGAVPWYQGIELFTGLKRLQKPVWMLNYNEDDHNLMKNANRMDLSIRMRQFFDFYLQDKPAPAWLSTGVPAIQKGKQSPLE